MTDLRASLIRTIVPMVVGAIVSFCALHGLVIPAAGLTELVTALVSAAYYAGVRFLETKVSPKFGLLLGTKAKPVYTKPSA
jgi:hypothetical protein